MVCLEVHLAMLESPGPRALLQIDNRVLLEDLSLRKRVLSMHFAAGLGPGI